MFNKNKWIQNRGMKMSTNGYCGILHPFDVEQEQVATEQRNENVYELSLIRVVYTYTCYTYYTLLNSYTYYTCTHTHAIHDWTHTHVRHVHIHILYIAKHVHIHMLYMTETHTHAIHTIHVHIHMLYMNTDKDNPYPILQYLCYRTIIIILFMQVLCLSACLSVWHISFCMN